MKIAAIFIISIIVLLTVESCGRVPVHVVQYADEKPVVVAPVGVVEFSATSAVMNPRVMSPDNVGPLPPKPHPSGIDWIGMVLGALGAFVPAAGVVSVLWARARQAVIAAQEMSDGIQAVKDRISPKTKDNEMPAIREEMNRILQEKQKKSHSFIKKLINKGK